ncbi:MAG: hypothetical protein ABI333_27425 [bacterium]
MIAPRTRFLVSLFAFLTLFSASGCAQDITNLVLCETDDDCPDGYCHDRDNFCVSGQRECLVDTDCSPPLTICDAGQCVEGCGLGGCALGEACNTVTGRCRFVQSCTIDSQCNPPGLVCVADLCEPGCGITGCSQGFCDPYSGHCQGGTSCSGDTECAPPTTVCVGDVCMPGCLSAGCSGTDQCNQLTGRCQPAGGCGGDYDCNPPSTICEGTACVPGCQPGGCGAQQCNTSTGRCEPIGGCTGDQDCNPPSTICEGTACVPGCQPGSCSGGLQCNTSTGRCETATLLLDGADCTSNGQCLSGYCMDIIVANIPYQVCSRPCCTEYDCAVGAACLYHRGIKQCVPDRIYPAGYNFTQGAGQACASGGPYCRSGFCNYYYGTCARTCCESTDCGVDECVWYFDEPTQYMFELCANAAGLPNAHTGTYCTAQDQCTSMVCVANLCADLCCTNSDCPGGYLCAQVLGQSSNPVATTVCQPGTPGAGAEGATCTAGDAPSPYCQSGLCAMGICRTPCCQDSDCPGASSCLPVPSGFDLNNDGISDWVRGCL